MSETVNVVRGICYKMCSDREIKWREKNRLIHFFEMLPSSNTRSKADPNKVVKQFSRSAAGKSYTLPEDLRPSPTLRKTMDYLINEIISRNDRPYLFIYDFVNDRIQAIRQDITIQMIEDINTVDIFEKCVKFYLLSSYILCEETTFDLHLNNQQLTICLEKLLALYNNFKSKHFYDFLAIYFCQNMLHFETFHLTFPQFKDQFMHQTVKLSIETCISFIEGNFIRYFMLVKKMSLFLAISFFHYFPQIRKHALKVMCFAYSSNDCIFPLEKLCSWICIKDKSYVLSLCNTHNIKITGSSVSFNKKNFKIADLTPLRKEDIIEEKFKDVSLSMIINDFK